MSAEARLNWERAATKAESVLVRHPSSRWADDALVLRGEGLARSGGCAAAAEPLARALREVTDTVLRERAALAAAGCALAQRDAADAEALLEPVRASRDGRRSARASYLAGRAALLRGDPETAAARFARSDLPEAASARVGALAAAGRGREAVLVADSVARRDADEGRWADAIAAVARTAGAETAADALDRLLLRSRLGAGVRARLLIEDGDRLRQVGLVERATARYEAVVRSVPDSAEADVARVRALRAVLAQARTPDDLDSVSARLAMLLPSLGGARQAEARELARRIDEVRRIDSSDIAGFRAAEQARDSLEAPLVAAALFRRFQARHPASLFAPKALIAAGQLQPETLGAVDAELRSRYPDSPYALAFHGAPSPAFQAAEDSLARALGVARPAAPAPGNAAGSRVAAPRTGPRGPLLERPDRRP
jgi:hypothetical protein